MNRRNFTKICTSIIVAASGNLAEQSKAYSKESFQRSKLQARKTGALKASDLIVGEPYLFFYPFVTTPCLLVKLSNSTSNSSTATKDTNLKDNKKDNWIDGTGPDNTIVAYSAICSHKMSHPAKEISFINYRHDPINFYSRDDGKTVEKAGLISCCSERSIYDPAQGAKVLSGPAPHPLAAITLDYDESTDELYATGSYGADMYCLLYTSPSPRD